METNLDQKLGEAYAAGRRAGIAEMQSAGIISEKGTAPLVGTGSMVGLPRRPWVASQQYSMRFILSADNEILVRADHLPIEILRAMAEAANTWQPNTKMTDADLPDVRMPDGRS